MTKRTIEDVLRGIKDSDTPRNGLFRARAHLAETVSGGLVGERVAGLGTWSGRSQAHPPAGDDID